MSDRLSPLHRIHEDAGASFTDFAGWRMPVRYSSELAEHHAVRTAAGLFDLSHMGEVVVLGAQAAEALDYAVSGRMSALEEGRAKYTLLLADDGGVLDDLIVYRTGADRFLVVANASNRELVASELARRADGFDAQVFDESDDVALIALQGPKSPEILAEVEGLDVTDLEGLRYYRFARGSFRGHEVLVARTGYTGENGFELFLAPEAAPELWEAIAETGAGSGLLPAGLAARDTLRLEAGMPLYGSELSRAIRPAQAGLARTVDLTKEDFVGRLGVEPPADAPVLVGLAAEGRRAARAGYPVLADAEGGDPIGEVTSGALSPTLGHPIAMAYVPPAVSAAGTQLFVDVRGTRIPASVVALPFYKREA